MATSSITCHFCFAEFLAKRADAKYCSPSHRVQASQRRRSERQRREAHDLLLESGRIARARLQAAASGDVAAFLAAEAESKALDAVIADLFKPDHARANAAQPRRGGEVAE